MRTTTAHRLLRQQSFLAVVIAAALACGTQAAGAQMLAIDLVDTPAAGSSLNARGDVVGAKSVWPCGDPFRCAPQTVPSVWTRQGRFSLPTQAGLYAAPAALAPNGVVVGSLTDYASTSKAVIWQRVGGAYVITELGTLPNLLQSAASGLDAQGHVVGYSTTPFVGTRPFSWTAAGGMVDLTLSGFPADRPWDVSPGGRVVSDGYTYLLNDPRSVRPLPAPPAGYYNPVGQGMRLNDNGDLAAFLATTSSQPRYLFHRYSAAAGQWQLLSGIAHSPSTTIWGIGSIDPNATITGTVGGSAVIAEGPGGSAQSLLPRLSPAYAAVTLDRAQAHNASGVILAHAGIGRSNRLVKLVPIAACSGACLRVSALDITGKFIPDPNAPGSCTKAARDRVATVVHVTDAGGAPQPGVKVRARYMDNYALSHTVGGTTAADGSVTLRHEGPACVGTISLLVEALKRAGWQFDRGAGVLTAEVIPLP
jgi:hypothetical protein